MAAPVPSHSSLPDSAVDHGHVAVDSSGQSLNQALDPHLSQGPHYHNHYTPQHLIPQDHTTHPPPPHHAEHLAFYPSAHPAPTDMSVASVDRQQNASPAKRKQSEAQYVGGSVGKKRRQASTYDGEEADEDPDGEGGQSGARHWTDEEKTTLFNWLMGPGEDEHFDALRTKKNTCFRDCAQDAFGGRKTFLAVKGCYERNFVVFKQIFTFETFTSTMQQSNVNDENEVDRLREYERRIYNARKAGFHVGNLSARILDHWHRTGWYATFHSRWNGDPNVRRPPARGKSNMAPPPPVPAHAPPEQMVEPSLQNEENIGHNAVTGPSQSFEQDNSFDQGETAPSPPTPNAHPGSSHYAPSPYTFQPPPPQPPTNEHQIQAGVLAMAQTTMNACMRMLQTQAEDSKLRLEYLRRREDREEEESRLRLEMEKQRHQRESAEWERLQQQAKVKQKTELATDILSNHNVEGSVKQAAGDYLKKLFATD